jgi:hypothetical protein
MHLCVCYSVVRHLSKELFQQNRFQSRVQRLSNILQQHGHSSADTVLHCPQQPVVTHLHYLQAVLQLAIANPTIGLFLSHDQCSCNPIGQQLIYIFQHQPLRKKVILMKI